MVVSKMSSSSSVEGTSSFSVDSSTRKRPRPNDTAVLPTTATEQDDKQSVKVESHVVGERPWALTWHHHHHQQQEDGASTDYRRLGRLHVTQSMTLCLTGQGRIRREQTFTNIISQPKDVHVSLNGYTLQSCSNDSWVFFDGGNAQWMGTSWITLQIRLQTVASCSVTLQLEDWHDIQVWDALATTTPIHGAPLPYHQHPQQPTFGKPLVPRPTVIPNAWEEAVDQVLQDYQKQSKSCTNKETTNELVDPLQFRVAVVGGKGVGKSTFLRYLINRWMSILESQALTKDGKNDENSNHDNNHPPLLAVLDADSGQPLDGGPPGILSYSRYSRPLLSHSYAGTTESQTRHLYESLFYGSNTSQVDPTRYMQAVEQLARHHEQDDHPVDDGFDNDDSHGSNGSTNMPLCINMDGWIKGLGEQVLQALLTKLRPTHIICIVGDSKSQQLDVTSLLQTPDASEQESTSSLPTIHNIYSYSSVHHAPTIQGTVETSLNGDGQDAPTLQVIPTPSALSIAASSLRALRLCLYFVPQLTYWGDRVNFVQDGLDDPTCLIAHTLASDCPYAVSMDAVTWGTAVTPEITNDLPSPESFLQAMNGSIVGLCYRSHDNHREPHLLPCKGLGIVRSIDIRKRMFYILTPIDPSDCNCLVLGNILLPLECYFRDAHSESFDYLSIESSKGKKNDRVLGSAPMKSRNSIARKSQTSKR